MGRFIEMRDKLVGHLIGGLPKVGQRPTPSPFSSGIGFEGGANPFSDLRNNKPIPKDSVSDFDKPNPFTFSSGMNFRQK